jgi:Domain of unknown function (DUF4293)
MIQRKQTIWLFLAIICMVLSIYIPFGHQAHLAPTSTAVTTIDLKANYSIISILLVSISIAIAGFAIFLFKNRKLQGGLCLLGFLVAVVLGIYEFMMANDQVNNYVVSFGIALPVVASLLFIMAYLGVRADEKLVKSVDRLRD